MQRAAACDAGDEGSQGGWLDRVGIEHRRVDASHLCRWITSVCGLVRDSRLPRDVQHPNADRGMTVRFRRH